MGIFHRCFHLGGSNAMAGRGLYGLQSLPVSLLIPVSHKGRCWENNRVASPPTTVRVYEFILTPN